ncbi:MAG: 2-C-methyl-D-erythritol 2,4-cyclodiphosphate synthase [Candidatus Eutrophobiaceae bacterium]
MNFRIGQGCDAHRLVEGRILILGGVRIPHDKGLLGHSDADVLLHAICDALLGAAGLGDIGRHFPDSDPAFRNADSRELLGQVAKMLHQAKFVPVNVDATLFAEAPRIAPYIPSMQANIAAILAIQPSVVNVKATTFEGMGFIGRQEGIAAQAVALIELPTVQRP